MKVDGIFNINKVGRVITGSTPWEDEVYYKIGDILICGDKKWKVTGISRIHQGCFSVPVTRYHSIVVEPINHDEMPNIGDDVVHDTPTGIE